MRGVRPCWAPLPGVLALLVSINKCRQGPGLALFLTGASLHSHLQEMGSYCMPGTEPGAREAQGSKIDGCALELPHE